MPLLEDHLKKIYTTLDINGLPKKNKEGFFYLDLEPNIQILFKQIENSIQMITLLASCPQKNQEDFFKYLLRGNFLGKGSNEHVIGLNGDEKHIVLSQTCTSSIAYTDFRNLIESFANTADDWKEKIDNFAKEQTEEMIKTDFEI